VAAGELESVRTGVFTLPGVARTWPQAALATVLAAGEGAVASHSTAGRLWEFRYYDDSGFEITMPRNRRPTLNGVRIHTSDILETADRSVRDLVPCTSFERTLCDSTTQLSWLQLGRVLDDGLRRKVTTLDGLHACVERLDSGPQRRLSVVQGLLGQRTAGYNPGDSDAELRLLSLLEKAGLPLPVQQHPVRVDGHRYELDFAWPEIRAFVEYYGLPWHIGASAVVRDSARITRLSNSGWRLAIFTDESTDAEIIGEVTKLLELAATDWPIERRGA
jgi:hypothetical protein